MSDDEGGASGTYRADRRWSDRYIDQICQIVGPLLLTPAPLELDLAEATDLIVLKARDMRIAARVRRHGYYERYPREFTIRTHRRGGIQTEADKLWQGFGDWMFYGHASKNAEPEIEHWMIIDLHAWREHMSSNFTMISNSGGCEDRVNRDQQTAFTAFYPEYFPSYPQLVVASNIPGVGENS